LRHFRTGLAFEAKPDDSPVTAADRECEQFIARELERAFPDDGLLGEEGAKAEIWVETSGKPWDFAPLKIIAREAGARFFDFTGNSTIYGGNCVIRAPALEDTVSPVHS
jgi:fructose-1,6-bisphosphatase/inositol monophosphatase family enzyme